MFASTQPVEVNACSLSPRRASRWLPAFLFVAAVSCGTGEAQRGRTVARRAPLRRGDRGPHLRPRAADGHGAPPSPSAARGRRCGPRSPRRSGARRATLCPRGASPVPQDTAATKRNAGSQREARRGNREHGWTSTGCVLANMSHRIRDRAGVGGGGAARQDQRRMRLWHWRGELNRSQKGRASHSISSIRDQVARGEAPRRAPVAGALHALIDDEVEIEGRLAAPPHICAPSRRTAASTVSRSTGFCWGSSAPPRGASHRRPGLVLGLLPHPGERSRRLGQNQSRQSLGRRRNGPARAAASACSASGRFRPAAWNCSRRKSSVWQAGARPPRSPPAFARASAAWFRRRGGKAWR